MAENGERPATAGGTHDDEVGVDTELHEKEGSYLAGWPALVITVGIIAAAIYSFTPRPDPPSAPTVVRPDALIVNALERQEATLVAAGELGIILRATSPGGPWQPATVTPQRGSTFTRMSFVAPGVAVAVGHDSWIVRSTDGGHNWTEVLFEPERSEPLLNLAGPYAGRLFAFGAFGQFLESADLGQSWTRRTIEAAAEAEQEQEYDPTTDPESPQYDPFAAFSSGSIAEDFSTFHLNAMARLQDGSWLLVGERGLIARSTDDTQTWRKLDAIYSGSFYGVQLHGEKRVLIHGMRGHAFVSDDFGSSWRPSRVPVEASLFGGTVTADGRIALVGSNNTIIVSADGGDSFTKVSVKGASAIATVLRVDQGWLTGGEAGIQTQQPITAVARGADQ